MNWFMNLNPIYQIALVLCAITVAGYAAIGVVKIIRYVVEIIRDYRSLQQINLEFNDEWMDFNMWEETK